MIYLLALVVGTVCGLCAFTAPAAVAWAAHGWLHLDGTWVAFLGCVWTPLIFTVFTCVEYVADQIPSTPSRKVSMQFAARLLSGAFSRAAIGAAGGSWIGGLVAGVIGAVIGSYGRADIRGRLVKAYGQDRPAGLHEDAVAILVGLVTVAAV